MDRWMGKVAIVTGTSSGIGASIATELANKGLIVVAVARRVERVEQLVQKVQGDGKLIPYKADVAKEEDILTLFDWVKENLGPVHILINNAGVMSPGKLIDGDTKMWQHTLNVNVMGLLVATREAIKVMTENDIKGHIIHINSVLGHNVLVVGTNIYTPSKFAVTAITETHRRELNLAESKIKITSISPGLVRSEMTRGPDLNQEDLKNFETMPILEPEDITEGVIYALSTPEHVQVHELMIKPLGEPY